MKKEYFYVGHYILDGNYYLKIGTTNDLGRRQKEHNRHYKTTFIYDWSIALSKYTTLMIEDKTREAFKSYGWNFIPNDRFVFPENEHPTAVKIKVRKEYEVTL